MTWSGLASSSFSYACCVCKNLKIYAQKYIPRLKMFFLVVQWCIIDCSISTYNPRTSLSSGDWLLSHDSGGTDSAMLLLTLVISTAGLAATEPARRPTFSLAAARRFDTATSTRHHLAMLQTEFSARNYSLDTTQQLLARPGQEQ